MQSDPAPSPQLTRRAVAAHAIMKVEDVDGELLLHAVVWPDPDQWPDEMSDA